MEKNRLLLFLFSFMPGAGQMYLGMMKKGVFLMSLFCGVIFVSAFFSVEFLLFLLPVIWFYAFFDALNSGHLTYEERKLIDSDFSLDTYQIFSGDMQSVLQKRHALIGGLCILAGFYVIFDNVLREFIWRLDEILPGIYSVFHKLPTLVIAIVIIIWGIRLVKGEKQPLPIPKETDFKEFEGDKHE